MFLYDQNIQTSAFLPLKSWIIFGNLQLSLEICGKSLKTIVWPLDNFWEISRSVGNLQKIVKKSSLVHLYNKQNMAACKYGISLWLFNLTCLSFTALTREISSWTLKEKFHIHVHPCIILIYILPYTKQKKLVTC